MKSTLSSADITAITCSWNTQYMCERILRTNGWDPSCHCSFQKVQAVERCWLMEIYYHEIGMLLLKTVYNCFLCVASYHCVFAWQHNWTPVSIPAELYKWSTIPWNDAFSQSVVNTSTSNGESSKTTTRNTASCSDSWCAHEVKFTFASQVSYLGSWHIETPLTVEKHFGCGD
jgi:hypothetical protein